MYTIYSYFLEAATRGVLYKKANTKQIFSLDQYYLPAIFDHDFISRNDPQNFRNINHS